VADPLMSAAAAGNAQVVRLLLDRHARVDLKDNQGRTVLDCMGWPGEGRIRDCERVRELLQRAGGEGRRFVRGAVAWPLPSLGSPPR